MRLKEKREEIKVLIFIENKKKRKVKRHLRLGQAIYKRLGAIFYLEMNFVLELFLNDVLYTINKSLSTLNFFDRFIISH